MKYERIYIDSGPMSAWLPDGAHLVQTPDLPMLKFEANKVKYEVTDLRLLHPAAVDAFERILYEVVSTPDCESVEFDTSGVSDDVLNIIDDILIGMSFKAKKSGRNGFYQSGRFLVESMHRVRSTATDAVMSCTYNLIKDHARWIHEYAKGREKLSLVEMTIELVDKGRASFVEYLTKSDDRVQTID